MINHKCVNCGKIYEEASEEILKGCICGGKLFYFVKASDKVLEPKSKKSDTNITDKYFTDSDQEEEFIYQYDEDNKELILFDVEAIDVVENGKYNIDIEGLMSSKSDNLIYKYDEGKYSVDIEAGLKKIKKRPSKKKLLEVNN